jgi:hypothetical protein
MTSSGIERPATSGAVQDAQDDRLGPSAMQLNERAKLGSSFRSSSDAMTPQELQNLLDEIEASRASRKRAWENLAASGAGRDGDSGAHACRSHFRAN